MHLGSRIDRDHGRTRTVVWSANSESDLGVVVAAAIASAVFAASTACALTLQGAARVAAIVVAVVSGLYASAMLVPLLVVAAGIFFIKGVASTSSVTRRASWYVAAVALGALLGTDVYAVGVPGFLAGPIVVAAAVALVKARPTLSHRARRRALELSVVAAVAAVGVGLTIFF